MEITRANVTVAASRRCRSTQRAELPTGCTGHRGDDEKQRPVGIVAFGGVERGHHLRHGGGDDLTC